MTSARRDTGVSLLELAAVMAIFSVLSLMGVQLLSQTLVNRDAMATTDARVAALASTVAVLRRDLEQALPQPDATEGRPVFHITSDSVRVAVATPSGSAQVTWRVDPADGRLLRSQDTIATAPFFLDEVRSMQIEIFNGEGWTDGTAWEPSGPADLPQGLRVILSLRDLEDIPIVVAR